MLSAPEHGVSKAIERVLTSHHSLEKALETAKENLLAFEKQDLLENKNGSIIRASFTDRTVQELQKLARLLVAEDESVIALFVAESEDKLQFVAASGPSVRTSMKQISAAVLPILNGKGGGNDSFVQGGGERTLTAAELLNLMENTIS